MAFFGRGELACRRSRWIDRRIEDVFGGRLVCLAFGVDWSDDEGVPALF